MPDLGGLADKAKDAAGNHQDKVDQGIDKAGDRSLRGALEPVGRTLEPT